MLLTVLRVASLMKCIAGSDEVYFLRFNARHNWLCSCRTLDLVAVHISSTSVWFLPIQCRDGSKKCIALYIVNRTVLLELWKIRFSIRCTTLLWFVETRKINRESYIYSFIHSKHYCCNSAYIESTVIFPPNSIPYIYIYPALLP